MCASAPSSTPLCLDWNQGCQTLAAGFHVPPPSCAHAPRDAHPPPTQPLLEAPPPSHLPSRGGAEPLDPQGDAGRGKGAEHGVKQGGSR